MTHATRPAAFDAFASLATRRDRPGDVAALRRTLDPFLDDAAAHGPHVDVLTTLYSAAMLAGRARFMQKALAKALASDPAIATDRVNRLPS